MIKIILDNFGRRWLFWALFCLVSVFAGLQFGLTPDIRISGVAYISMCLIFFDLGSAPRILLSLPFTARQIGRAYWYLSVAMPTVFFGLFSRVGILILNLGGVKGSFLGPWLEIMLAAGFVCGTMFWFMSGGPVNTVVPGRRRFRQQLYAWAFTIVVLGGIYFLCNSNISSGGKTGIAFFFGLVFTVLGWLRAERMVVEYTSYRRAVAGVETSRGKFEPRPGYGGVPYLIICFCLVFLAIIFLLVPGSIGVAALGDHRFEWSDAVGGSFVQVQIWSFGLCLFQALMIASHLNVLRSLPLTSKQLAATILCIALLPVLIIGGLWTVFFLIEPGVLPTLSALWALKYFLLDLMPICVLITGVFWYNEKHFRRIGTIVFAWIVSLVPLIYQLKTVSTGGLPMWIIIAIPAVCIPVTFSIIRRLLERNDMTYRLKWEIAGQWCWR